MVHENVLTQDEVDQQIADFVRHLDDAFEAAGNYKANKADWLDGAWTGMSIASDDARRGKT